MAHQLYASYLLATGRSQEALSEARQAQQLEPLSLTSNTQLARVLYFTRAYDEAIEQCRKVIEIDPSFGGAHLFLGRAYVQKGMYGDALVELERAKEYWGDSAEVSSLIGYAYAVSGRRLEAQKVLRNLQGVSSQRYVSPYHVAMVYAGLGERDKALDWLGKAYEDREGRMTILELAPEFDSLHSDARLAVLLRRMNVTW